MRSRTAFFLSAAAIALVLAAAIPSGPLHAQTPAALTVNNNEIGGMVTSPNGAEAGVWVIAETRDLPTRFARIVVTVEAPLTPTLSIARRRRA
jgi:hypothetical protein